MKTFMTFRQRLGLICSLVFLALVITGQPAMAVPYAELMLCSTYAGRGCCWTSI